MQLAAKSIRILQLYKRFREEDPTTVGIFWGARRGWILNVTLTIMLIALAFALPDFPRGVGFLAIGIGVGQFLRDVGYARASAQQWPLFKGVINWQRVDELLDEHERSTGG